MTKLASDDKDRELRVWALTRVGMEREAAERQIDYSLSHDLIPPLTDDERDRLIAVRVAELAAKERDERLLRAIGAADRASTSMTPYGPMNDKWMRGFLDALAAEGLAIVPVAADRLPDPARVQVACDRCTQGVMDATNPHLTGECGCECHSPVSAAVSPAEPPERPKGYTATFETCAAPEAIEAHLVKARTKAAVFHNEIHWLESLLRRRVLQKEAGQWP